MPANGAAVRRVLLDRKVGRLEDLVFDTPRIRAGAIDDHDVEVNWRGAVVEEGADLDCVSGHDVIGG